MFNKKLQIKPFLDKKVSSKIIFCLLFIFLNSFILYNTYIAYSNENSFFRIHVVANSNSIKDQLLKYTIADKLDKFILTLDIDKSISKDDAKEIIEENVQKILDICNNEIKDASLDYEVYANIGKIYYDEKLKDGYYMNPGIYDSLQIVIGEGKGENWWSLIYPNAYDAVVIYDEKNTKSDDTTHLSSSDIISSENITYKFGILEFISKLFE